MIAIKIYVSGQVQGVFFRRYIKEEADKLGLKGYVRNLEDGRVELFLEGNNEKVDKMIEITKKGSIYSQVRDLEIKDEKFQGLKEFRVY